MLSDVAIIDLYWKRNEQAISHTQEKYGAYCNAVAFNILGNHEDADECEHDTYLAAWNAIPPDNPSALRAYLAKITRNLSIALFRNRSAQKRGGGDVTLSLQELEGYIPSGRTSTRNWTPGILGRKQMLSGSDFHRSEHLARGGIVTEKRITCQSDLIDTLRSGAYSLIATEV